MIFKEQLNNVKSFDDYIYMYEHKYDNHIDMSPGQIQSSTENRMIQELKELNKLIYNKFTNDKSVLPKFPIKV